MTTKQDIIKEFDKEFPPYTGTGEPFPCFRANPNREHIKRFLIKALTQARADERKKCEEKQRIIEERKDPLGIGIAIRADERKKVLEEVGKVKKYGRPGYLDNSYGYGYNQAIKDIKETIKSKL